MKMDSLETFRDVTREIRFADLIKSLIVRNGTVLVEFSEEFIEVDDSS
jgi:hypothetical protein